MSNPAGLTSTTAPGKLFASRSELAEHYKSDWHKYNLKRREANMPMLTHQEFTARLEAAMALRKEREGREARSGTDHLKNKNSKKDKKKKSNAGAKRVSKRQQRQQERMGGFHVADEPVEEEEVEDMEEEELVEEEPPEIDPCQSLFDKRILPDVKSNIDYMYNKYGFFIPDREFLVDEEGLIGYCAEKIKLGHTCLYCQKMFRSWRGCQEHMVNSKHCKLKYEAGIDLEEFDVFYDFTADDEAFLQAGIGNYKRRNKKRVEKETDEDEEMEVIDEDEMDEDDGEWEDVDSDEEMEDGLYAAYQDEITRHGFDVTPLGELVFPDGRIIGHRGLSRYYKQRFTAEDDRTSVMAARRANGERLLNGQVYDTYAMRHGNGNNQDNSTALQLAKAGLAVGAARGRAGKGILVASGNGPSGAQSYTALSLYRYKAAVKKARKEEFKGRKLQERTSLPMNKMDKKANRLMNGVSVAHAAR